MAGDTQGNWDGRRLQQLLANLVFNAIKHGEAGTPVWVLVTGEETHVRLEVKNIGPGIEQSSLDNLFGPLTRGAEYEKETAGRSLGLGLFIAREIALAHGGEISARSENKETVFSVRLPTNR